MPKHALAIGAHPDDVEFLMAGTLALLQAGGWEVAIGVVAKGDCGTKEMSRKEITAVRRGEAEAAAKLLGAPVYFAGQNDLNIDVNAEARRKVTEIVRRARADLVLTHPPSDYMSDHEFTSRLVRDACFCASTPNYETEDPNPAQALDHIPALFYCSPIEGLDLYGNAVRPGFVVDVTTQLDLKRNMLACHASQRNWLRAQHGIDQYLIAMEEWGRTCGAFAGFEQGEGFTQHLGHAFPRENHIETALGARVRILKNRA
ncbi:MAG: PIG-L family deacetylase [Candidatus Omnitrophica bacterium]|nr:hypothetical protein [bacterium]NUN97886.1 PIG-L family deacetylase [Candidatus Omnitrophota bacterium]